MLQVLPGPLLHQAGAQGRRDQDGAGGGGGGARRRQAGGEEDGVLQGKTKNLRGSVNVSCKYCSISKHLFFFFFLSSQLLEHYRSLCERDFGKSTSALLRSEFPRLAPGLVCSALHPLIHIGYALGVGADETVSAPNQYRQREFSDGLL